MHVDSTPTVKYTTNTWQNTNGHVEEMVFPKLQVSLLSQCKFMLSQS